MVPQVPINYLAILVSSVVSMMLGALWYSPLLFGKEWMKLMGIDEKKMKGMKKKGVAKSYILGFIGNLITTFVLAHFVRYTGAESFIDGMQTALLIWIGFVATVMLGTILWEGKPVRLYLINSAYYLVMLLIAGGILAVWV